MQLVLLKLQGGAEHAGGLVTPDLPIVRVIAAGVWVHGTVTQGDGET